MWIILRTIVRGLFLVLAMVKVSSALALEHRGPVRVWGELSSTYRVRESGVDESRDSNLLNTGTIRASSYIWRPWFAQVNGEKVVVFLYKAGAATGFRTTVGLFQGKFAINAGKISNKIDNQGLFQGIQIDPKLTTDLEAKMLQSKQGSVPADPFISLVDKAVKQNWINRGSMRHVK